MNIRRSPRKPRVQNLVRSVFQRKACRTFRRTASLAPMSLRFAVSCIAALVIAGMAQQRILAAYTLNNPCVIRMEPPLIITSAQIAHVLEAFDHAIGGVMELLG